MVVGVEEVVRCVSRVEIVPGSFYEKVVCWQFQFENNL